MDTFNLHLHHSTETPELMSLPEQELKMVYANDYRAAVSTLVATRATLLQVVPALAILFVFADLMAGTPLLVQDKKLALSLPELIAKDPFGKARRMEAEFTGTVNQMRQGDMSNEDDCATIPGHADLGDRPGEAGEGARTQPQHQAWSNRVPAAATPADQGVGCYAQGHLLLLLPVAAHPVRLPALHLPPGGHAALHARGQPKSFIYAGLAIFLPRASSWG